MLDLPHFNENIKSQLQICLKNKVDIDGKSSAHTIVISWFCIKIQ